MSALTLRTAAVTRRLATTSTAATLQRAAFTTTVRHQKTTVDTAKEKLKAADRKVSDKLVDGINIGSAYANKLKEASHDVSAGKVTGKASELRDEMEGKAHEMAGEAKEMAGEAKGKAHEVAGEARGVKEEVKGEVKRKMS